MTSVDSKIQRCQRRAVDGVERLCTLHLAAPSWCRCTSTFRPRRQLLRRGTLSCISTRFCVCLLCCWHRRGFFPPLLCLRISMLPLAGFRRPFRPSISCRVFVFGVLSLVFSCPRCGAVRNVLVADRVRLRDCVNVIRDCTRRKPCGLRRVPLR